MRPSEVSCPSCGAKPGEPCYTPIDGVDTKWDHDTRILRAMFTDAPVEPVPMTSIQVGDEVLKPGYLEPHRLESLGAHYAPATWRDHEGGYVGHANWRDKYGMGTTSGCGHRHRQEDVALRCIEAKLAELAEEAKTFTEQEQS